MMKKACNNNWLKSNDGNIFEEAPNFNENAQLIKGVICGYRVEEIEWHLLRF